MTGGTDAPARTAAPLERAGRRADARLLGVAPVVGLAVGAATSWGQTLLGDSLLAGLTNAVSPWVVAAFLLGARASGRGPAAAVGVVAALAQVVGYYGTAALRDYEGSAFFVALWAAAAVLAGVVFGMAGHSWRSATGRERGLGAALLVAVWACEAVVTFGVVLGYVDDAVVSGVVAVLLFALLARRGHQYAATGAWLVPALALGVGGLTVLHAL